MKKIFPLYVAAFLLCAVPSLAADEEVAVSATPSVSAEMMVSAPVSVDAPVQNEEKIPPVEMRGNENQNRGIEAQGENFRQEMGGRNHGEGREMRGSWEKGGENFAPRNFDRNEHDGFWGIFWTGFLSLALGAAAGIGGTVWFLRRKEKAVVNG